MLLHTHAKPGHPPSLVFVCQHSPSVCGSTKYAIQAGITLAQTTVRQTGTDPQHVLDNTFRHRHRRCEAFTMRGYVFQKKDRPRTPSPSPNYLVALSFALCDRGTDHTPRTSTTLPPCAKLNRVPSWNRPHTYQRTCGAETFRAFRQAHRVIAQKRTTASDLTWRHDTKSHLPITPNTATL